MAKVAISRARFDAAGVLLRQAPRRHAELGAPHVEESLRAPRIDPPADHRAGVDVDDVEQGSRPARVLRVPEPQGSFVRRLSVRQRHADQRAAHLGCARPPRQEVAARGVPQTYPPRPIEGTMVSCFLTPSTKSEYTYPRELKAEVERVSGGYVLDVEDFRTTDKADLLKRIYDKTRKHFAVGRHLVRTRPWDFFMLVEMGVDRIHHAFWSYADPEHHKFVPGNPYVNSLRDYYRFLDAEIGELLALLPADTIVLVVSDHGSKKMDGGICFNEWLIAEGYLTLAERVDKPTPIGKVKIDWSRSAPGAMAGTTVVCS